MKHQNVSKALEFSKRPLTVVLVLGLAIRLVLAPLLIFELDFGYWLRITGLLESGFTLYDTLGYYYTPIWGYIVGLFSALGSLIGISDLATFVPELAQYTSGAYFLSEYVVSPAYAVMMKLPIVLADTATAYLLYDLVRSITSNERKAVSACALWYLCPFVILISSVHGMFDSISAMLILLTISFINKRSYFLGGISFSLAILTKFFPIFFVFFLAAYVLRREGINRNGVKQLSIAILGTVVALTLVQLPVMIRGQYWESLFFLTDRIGVSTEFMYSLTTPKMLLIYVSLLCIAIVLGLWLHKVRYPSFRRYVISLGFKERNRRVKVFLISLGVVFTFATVGYSFVSFFDGMSSTTIDVLESLGERAVMLLSFYTIVLEMYLAYRLLECESMDVRTIFTILMLSSMAIFLWPPLPQYVIVIVPFLILYAVLVKDSFKKPLRRFSTVMFVYELFVLNASVLFSLAVYTDIVPLELPLAVTDVASQVIFGIPVSGMILGILVILEYVVMLGIFKFWYDGWKVCSDEE